MYGIVYLAQNQITNECYVGATTQGLEKRRLKHIEDSKNGRKTKFCEALQLWGPENCKWEVLEKCKDAMGLANRESYWTDKIGTIGFGYNMVNYQSGIFNEETRKRMSEAQKLLWNDPEHREKMSRQHIGNTYHLGHKHSEETKKKMSKAKIGHIPWNKGMKGVYHFSREVRDKISESLRGRKVLEETRERIRIGNLGKKRTEETIQKIKESKKGLKNPLYGKHHTKETKRKISIALQGNQNRRVKNGSVSEV